MKRTVLELRLIPNLLFYTKKEEVGKELTKYFPDWINNALNINLFNKDTKTSCILEFNRLAIICDDTQSEHKFFELANEIINIYTSKIKIGEVLRVGIRDVITENTSLKYKELVTLFQEKFYPKSKEIQDLLVKDFSDVAFAADFEKLKYKFHYMMGPVNKDEGLKRFNPNPKFDIKESDFVETMIFLDVDGYLDSKIKFAELDGNIKGIKEAIGNIIKGSLHLFNS